MSWVARLVRARQPDGSDSPYEMNVSYLSALTPRDGDSAMHAKRFLTTQAIMLALQGMPAIYFHSLVGTENDLEGMQSSGIPRRINRRKFVLEELNARLADEDSLSRNVFDGLQRLLGVRIRQSAFHPNAEQAYWETEDDPSIGFHSEKTSQQASRY